MKKSVALCLLLSLFNNQSNASWHEEEGTDCSQSSKPLKKRFDYRNYQQMDDDSALQEALKLSSQEHSLAEEEALSETLSASCSMKSTMVTSAAEREEGCPTKRRISLIELRDDQSAELYKKAFDKLYYAIEYGDVSGASSDEKRKCHSSKFSLIHWMNKEEARKWQFSIWYSFDKDGFSYDYGDAQIVDAERQRELVALGLYGIMYAQGIDVGDFSTSSISILPHDYSDVDEWLQSQVISKMYDFGKKDTGSHVRDAIHSTIGALITGKEDGFRRSLESSGRSALEDGGGLGGLLGSVLRDL